MMVDMNVVCDIEDDFLDDEEDASDLELFRLETELFWSRKRVWDKEIWIGAWAHQELHYRYKRCHFWFHYLPNIVLTSLATFVSAFVSDDAMEHKSMFVAMLTLLSTGIVGVSKFWNWATWAEKNKNASRAYNQLKGTVDKNCIRYREGKMTLADIDSEISSAIKGVRKDVAPLTSELEKQAVGMYKTHETLMKEQDAHGKEVRVEDLEKRWKIYEHQRSQRVKSRRQEDQNVREFHRKLNKMSKMASMMNQATQQDLPPAMKETLMSDLEHAFNIQQSAPTVSSALSTRSTAFVAPSSAVDVSPTSVSPISMPATAPQDFDQGFALPSARGLDSTRTTMHSPSICTVWSTHSSAFRPRVGDMLVDEASVGGRLLPGQALLSNDGAITIPKVDLPGALPLSSEREACWSCKVCGADVDMSSSACNQCNSKQMIYSAATASFRNHKGPSRTVDAESPKQACTALESSVKSSSPSTPTNGGYSTSERPAEICGDGQDPRIPVDSKAITFAPPDSTARSSASTTGALVSTANFGNEDALSCQGASADEKPASSNGVVSEEPDSIIPESSNILTREATFGNAAGTVNKPVDRAVSPAATINSAGLANDQERALLESSQRSCDEKRASSDAPVVTCVGDANADVAVDVPSTRTRPSMSAADATGTDAGDGWIKVESRSRPGNFYFYNPSKGVSQFQPP